MDVHSLLISTDPCGVRLATRWDESAGFPHATLLGSVRHLPPPEGRCLDSRQPLQVVGAGEGRFLCVAGGGQFLSRSFSSYWALLPLVLWPERATLVGVFCVYPLAFPVAEVFKPEITWGRKKPRELSAVSPWPRGPRSAPSFGPPSRVSRHYWHVGLQGGAVSPFISEQKVPVPSLKYFFLSVIQSRFFLLSCGASLTFLCHSSSTAEPS